jgi:hypothetical protein
MNFKQFFGNDWRTTLAAIISTIAGFIATNPEFVENQFIVKLSQYICMGGVAALGINARDKQTGRY